MADNSNNNSNKPFNSLQDALSELTSITKGLSVADTQIAKAKQSLASDADAKIKELDNHASKINKIFEKYASGLTKISRQTQRDAERKARREASDARRERVEKDRQQRQAKADAQKSRNEAFRVSKEVDKAFERLEKQAAARRKQLDAEEEKGLRNADNLLKKFGYEKIARGGKLEATPNSRLYQDALKVAQKKESMIEKVKEDYHKKYETYATKKEKGNFFQKLTAKAPNEQKYIDQIDEIQGIKKPKGDSKGRLIASGLGLVPSLNISTIEGFFGLIRKAYDLTVAYINEKLLPTQSDLNKSFGATAAGIGQIRKQALTTGDQFWDLGLSFEQGAKDVTQLGLAMNTAYIPQANLKGLLTLSEYVGVGAEQAGKLANSFIASGGSLKELNDTMREATGVAEKYGVPVNMIRKEFAESPELLQRYGLANRKTFMDAIGYVKRYNVSIQEVGKTFGDTMDTFDKTSEISAKLNQTFGTNIDSIKLLTEYDPDKRFKMIRDALQSQGIVWDNLNGSARAYKGVIKNILQISDEEAARYFGSQKSIDQTRMNTKVTDDWNRGLQSLRKVLYDNTREMTVLARAFINLISRVLGFHDEIDGASSVAMAFKGAIEGTAKAVNKLAGMVPEGGIGVLDFLKKIGSLIENADHALKDLQVTMYRLNPGNALKGLGGGNELFDLYRSIDQNDPTARAKFSRVLHEEAGALPDSSFRDQFKNLYGKDFNDQEYDEKTREMYYSGKRKVSDISSPDSNQSSNFSFKDYLNQQGGITPQAFSPVINTAVTLQINGNDFGTFIAQSLAQNSQGRPH